MMSTCVANVHHLYLKFIWCSLAIRVQLVYSAVLTSMHSSTGLVQCHSSTNFCKDIFLLRVGWPLHGTNYHSNGKLIKDQSSYKIIQLSLISVFVLATALLVWNANLIMRVVLVNGPFGGLMDQRSSLSRRLRTSLHSQNRAYQKLTVKSFPKTTCTSSPSK